MRYKKPSIRTRHVCMFGLWVSKDGTGARNGTGAMVTLDVICLNILFICCVAIKTLHSYTSCVHVWAVGVKRWDRGKKWDWCYGHPGRNMPKYTLHLLCCYKNPPFVHVMCACLGGRCQKVGQGQEMGQVLWSPWTQYT